MAGEINGTNVILQNGTGAIVGQMEMTTTIAGSPIDISNKSAGDFITLMNNEVAGKQVTFSGSLVYNDNAQFRKIRADRISGAQDTYTMTYVSDASTDESFSATCSVTDLSDTIPHGDKITTSVTFSSSGAYTHTEAS